ncbi:MAG: hypothetical protein SFZ24_02855 [Planctomycetota bacterium]|nr:hypothetical protein [Planctomycetota bacterium]
MPLGTPPSSARNTAQRLPAARRGAMVLAGLLLAASPLLAADAPDKPPARESLEAFHRVADWVRAWDVPQEPVALDPPGTRGAHVALRFGGRVLGRGTALGEDGRTIWSAAREAWRQADPALPLERDALRADKLKEFAPAIQLEIELAGALTPMGRDWHREIGALSPGVEGVAARIGDALEAVFPTQMLATDVDPERGLSVVTGRLGLPPLPPAELSKRPEVRVYRFATRHLAQPRPGVPPCFLYRGSRIVGIGEVDGAALRLAAAQLSAHLAMHEWPGAERHGVMGDYSLHQDSFAPLIAPPFSQALAALALARYATCPGAEGASRLAAARLAGDILAELAIVEASESDPLEDPVAAAMIVLATREHVDARLTPASVPAEFVERAAAGVRSAVNDAGGWRPETPASGRSVIALALVSLARDEAPDAPVRRRAEAAVRAVFREIPPQALPTEMPWLAWAEMLLHPTGEIPAAEALRGVRDLARRFEVSPSDLDAAWLDCEGGVRFGPGMQSPPTWSTLKPAALHAFMLGDERLTAAGEVHAEVARMRPALRFLLQLTVREESLYLARDAERALGGVRPAPWSSTVSLDATSMALLALTETLRSLEARATPR